MNPQWIGCDISSAMLDVAVERGIEDGDVCLGDMGDGLPYRDGAFDGAISISAVQWLCNANASHETPWRRIRAFFTSLYRCLARGARAVLQMYPQNTDQAEMLVQAAMKAGFTGGLVVDYPHSTRAKKYFLVLMVGSSTYVPQAKGLNGETEEEEEAFLHGGNVKNGERKKMRRGGKMSSALVPKKGKAWVFKKKAQRERRGDKTANDSKYTARKRKPKF
jgi:18S rRNA (guanine1575-N7)-methyltransferase